jgi:sterol desaturase/sphingolipid hydroxylase (fatty acid hydroxylase superfamily)
MNANGRLILAAALAVTVVASLAEAWALRRRSRYDWKSMGTSLANLVLRNAMLVLLPLSIADPLLRWAWEHRIATQPLHSWGAVALLFLGQEFCYYWFHRASHRVRWFWVSHSVHHSPNQLNLSAAYRVSALGKLAGSPLFFAPLVWLGFQPQVVAAAVAFNLLYQFWIHAEWIPKLGWLELVLNTPSAHRVHHARNLEYLDANYGGVLIVFDRLFGTYVAERPDLPCDYGLVQRQTTYNPLRLEWAPWHALLKDLAKARCPRSAAGYLFGPPGWNADGTGDTTEGLRGRFRPNRSTRHLSADSKD